MKEGVSYEAFEAYLSQQRCPDYSGPATYKVLFCALTDELKESRVAALFGSWSESEIDWITAQGWTADAGENPDILAERPDDGKSSSANLVICRLMDPPLDSKIAYQIVSKAHGRLSAGGVLILEIRRSSNGDVAASHARNFPSSEIVPEFIVAEAGRYLGFSSIETRYFPTGLVGQADTSFVAAVILQKPYADGDNPISVVGRAINSMNGYTDLRAATHSQETEVLRREELLSAIRDWRSQSKMSADVIAELSSAALEAGSVSHRLSKAERRIRRLTWQTAIFLPLTYPLSLVISGVAGLVARIKDKRRKGRFEPKKKLPSDQQEIYDRQIVTSSPHAGYFASNSEPKILIVKLDHIGDFILSLPAIRILKDAWPHGHFTIVCSPTNSGLAKACGYFDEVREYNFFAQLSQDVKKADMSKFSRIRDVVGEVYDIAIDLRHDQDTRPTLAFVDAKIKAGYQTHGKQFVPLDVSLPPIPERSGLHKSPHNIRRLMLLCSHVVNSVKPLMFDAGSALVLAGREAPVPNGEKYAILAPGGGTLAKKWPAERFAELAVRIAKNHDLKIVVLGGAQEKEYGEAVSRALPAGQVFDLTGSLPLVDMAKVSAGATIFVGSDTGATQLAALLGTPTVAVFSGVADVNLWQPVGVRVEVVRRPIPCSPCYIAKLENCVQGHACMNDIQVDHVYKSVESLISTTE